MMIDIDNVKYFLFAYLVACDREGDNSLPVREVAALMELIGAVDREAPTTPPRLN